MKIGTITVIAGNTYMRVNKTTAKRCYYLNYAFEIAPHNTRQFVTICKKECNDVTFERMESEYKHIYFMPDSKYFDYYIPVRVIDKFTGNAPTKETSVNNHIFVYDSKAYQTLKAIWV